MVVYYGKTNYLKPSSIKELPLFFFYNDTTNDLTLNFLNEEEKQIILENQTDIGRHVQNFIYQNIKEPRLLRINTCKKLKISEDKITKIYQENNGIDLLNKLCDYIK